MNLARAFPNLKVIVQDLPEVESAFNEFVPSDLRSRVSFEARSFFTPQTTQADIYLMKMILHDWPNKDSSQIIRNLVPCLKPGAKILLCEVVRMPDEALRSGQVPLTVQHMLAGADIQMMCAFNSLERDLEQWKEVVKQADERLEITYVADVPGALQNVIEVTFRG